ncbi:Hypp1865 [Branchiostoma lanceolatum]|uniref:Hypp1865 protein n=1 Tax=Branchiostoma lanceolatum TaxID=7740 RepID=A0A8J9ZQ90_BRALA|nr:Hypp1865 [Branchiostoma lanceolatum]
MTGTIPGPISSHLHGRATGTVAGVFSACGEAFARGTTLPSLPGWQNVNSPVVCSLPIPEQGDTDSSHFWTLPGAHFGQQFPFSVSAGPILTTHGVPFGTIPPVVLAPRSHSALSRARKFCKKQATKIWIVLAVCLVVSLLIVLAYPNTQGQGSRVMHVPHQVNMKETLGHKGSNHGLMVTSSQHPGVKLPSVTPLTSSVSSNANPSTGVYGTKGDEAKERRPNPEQSLPRANKLELGPPRHGRVQK